MPSEKYSKTYLREQLPVELREHLREDNLPVTHLPTYEYLKSKGFETRGLAKAVKRHFGDTETLGSHLKKHGFGVGDGSEWPTDDAETLKRLNGYRESRRQRNDDAETTIETMESALRAVLKIAQRRHQTDSLLVFARYDDDEQRYARNQQVEEILDTLKDELSDGATQNYVRYFEDFYDYCESRTRIDHNPVSQVIGQYSFDTTPQAEVKELTDGQIEAIWETLKQLPDHRELTDSVENLVERHGLGEWQVQVMLLVILGAGVGPRSREYVRMQCRTHWHLDEDPHIEFPVRKNMPGEVPVMILPEFLEAYTVYMERTRATWNGKPFPSDQSESGSRSTDTLNKWLKAICEEAGVRLDDGTYPTLQNLRQRWMNHYLRILRESDVHVELVADEAGTKNQEHVKISYQSSPEERKTIRDLARDGFAESFDLPELPAEMYKVVEKGAFVNSQLSLADF